MIGWNVLPRWVAASNGHVPSGAVRGGRDGNKDLYVGRAMHGNELVPGKVCREHHTCYIPWGGKEIPVKNYEVLCDNNYHWVSATGGNIPAGAIPGSNPNHGAEVTYIGRAKHCGTTTIGKVAPSHGVCYIPYGGKEIAYKDFEILVSRHQHASHPAFKYVSQSQEWISAKHGSIPQGSVVGGRDHDCELYVGRACHKNDLIPGKVHPIHNVCYIPFEGEEIAQKKFEVLTGSNMHWIPNAQGNIPCGAVVGGKTAKGEPLYIGRATHNGALVIGKVHPSHRVCYIPYGGKEHHTPSYEILVSRDASNTPIYDNSSEKAIIPTATWVECADGDVSTANQEGNDNGAPIYVGRAYYNNELLPGKVIPGHKVCYVGWDGHEHAKNVYQVLCGRNLSWVPSSGGTVLANAVHGGKTSSGEILFIGRARHSGTVTIGKVHPSHGTCYIPYEGREISCQEYEILISRY